MGHEIERLCQLGAVAVEKPASRTNSVRVGSSFALPDVIRSLGHSPDAVFSAAGVDPVIYSHPENRIAVDDLGRVFDCAARATGRAELGLLVTSGFQPAGLGLVGLVAAEGPDVETALRNLVRLLPHNTLAGYPVLSVADGVAALKFELRYPDFPGAHFILEGATVIIFRFLQWLCGKDWRPEEVHLSRREPTNPRPFRSFFGCQVHFSATEDGVLFASNWLKHRIDREKRRLNERRLDIANSPFSELVRRQAAIGLGLEPIDSGAIAARLGLSRRQLFRSLKAEGTTCQKLVDDVRFSRARHLVSSGDAPIGDIATAMGYPDQSSFTRAFSRWSGVSPSEWRKREQIRMSGTGVPVTNDPA